MIKEKLTEFLTYKSIENSQHLKFSHNAMNTVYEILINNDDPEYAAQAANAAFLEIDRLELELSRFNQNSDIARINALKQMETITVTLDCFYCLEQCNQLYQQTKGVFDISAGMLIDLWKKLPPGMKEPERNDIKSALESSGMPWLHLYKENYQVQLMSGSISIDLGGFGKGYAIECAKKLLQDWDIEDGLINAGMSSMKPLRKSRWPVEIKHPLKEGKILKKIELNQKTISGSGRQKGQHIIDPRNGYPVKDRIASWAICENAGISDALSTAFMIMSDIEIEEFCHKNSDVGALIINAKEKVIQFGNF